MKPIPWYGVEAHVGIGGCWIWLGGSNGRYPVVSTWRPKSRYAGMSSFYAHRVVWEETNGKPIPDGMFVLHRCDVPLCVNPNHLYLGTHQDNMDDCGFKDRRAKGEKHGRAKLTEDQVLEIRDSTESQAGIAFKFRVSQSLVSLIKLRRKWKHV